MANSGGFSIAISAVDQATAKIDAVNKSLAKLRAPAENLNKSLHKFADVSGLEKVAHAWTEIGGKMRESLEVAQKFIPAMEALVGGGILYGLGKMYQGWTQLGRTLLNTQGVIGETTENTDKLRMASVLAGKDQGFFADQLGNMQKVMRESQLAMNPLARSLISLYKIDTTKTGLPLLVEEVEKLHSALEGKSAATKLDALARLGLSPDMLRFVNDPGRLRYLLKLSADLGATTEEEARAAEEAAVRNSALGLQFERVGHAISAKLQPFLTPMLKSFTTWLGSSHALENVMVGVTKALQGVVNVLGPMLRGIDKIVESTIGWERVGELVALYFAGKWIFRMLSVFGRLQAAILAIPVALRAAAAAAEVFSAAFTKTPLGKLLFLGLSIYGAMQTGGPKTSQKEIDQFYKDHPEYKGTTGSAANNPMALEYRSDQPGASPPPPGGRFGVFKTVEEGVAAGVRQILINQDTHGLNTIRQQITRWAPPGENDTEGYIARVSNALGVNANAPLNFHNQRVLEELVRVQSQVEHRNNLSSDQITKGVQMGLSPDKQASARVDIHLAGFPAGTRTASRSTGFIDAIRVVNPLPLYG